MAAPPGLNLTSLAMPARARVFLEEQAASFRQFDFPPGLEDITRFDGPVPMGIPAGTTAFPPPE
jgi:hypothetical protein